ncbi:ParB/Srx family N-terminal domain-containing protein, partial [Ferrovum sp.]|uniref:ParB/Srx family N-terminal domain-containing protein n=1 Tax=Ferrovum sp. TaxID=2609467 RepID=UPI00260F0FF9
MTHLHIEYRPVESLIPFAKNARTHTEEQITQIAASIREFGFNSPILVDGHHGIVSGHGRLSAARKLSMTEVPVIELEHLSDIQKRAFILAENKLAENAGWDHELLALELADLGASGVDLELTGFDASEIESMLVKAADEEGPSSDEPADEIPETPVKAIS